MTFNTVHDNSSRVSFNAVDLLPKQSHEYQPDFGEDNVARRIVRDGSEAGLRGCFSVCVRHR